MTSRAVAATRIARAAWIIAALLSPAVASADLYDAPSAYYTAATGTGPLLKTQLTTIMSAGHVQTSYADARDYLPITDANPSNLKQMFLVYDLSRTPVEKGSVDPQSFVSTYNSREHVWPDSLQGGGTTNSSTGSRGDIHMLKPAAQSANGDRQNFAYAGANLTGAARVVPGGGYFAGDVDKGDVARIILYAGTRWSSTLTVVRGTSPGAYQMGDLDTIMHWHYLDTPDLFERRRNDVIYSGDDAATVGVDDSAFGGTHNRNAYIDRPEYAWSVYEDQQNDTKLSFGTAGTDGGSTATVNLGRVLKGATPASQSITLSKAGVDGTYYSVTAGGNATSSVNGRYNAFAMDAAGSKAITVGMPATVTATPGLKTGTVTVDNLDVTTQGGAGVGANDANDVANLALSVLDVSNSSFDSGSDVNKLSLDFGTVKQGDAADSKTFSIANYASALGVDLTAGLDLDSLPVTGATTKFSTTLAMFKALAAGDAKTFAATFDTSAIGAYSATYTLGFSDEDLPGAQATTSLTLTLSGSVVAAPEPAVLLTFALVGGTLRRRRRATLAA